MKSLFLIAAAIAALLIFSCRKNGFITSPDAGVSFSADTVFFDTVFVTAGSVTQAVKIINSNNQKLRLTDVRLMGGSSSAFSINVDGSPGPEQDNIDLDAGDSLYVFIAVRIDPNAANLPFIVQDSIQVSFNGRQQYIQLQAWGQNAHFLRDQVLTGNVVWDSTLPYVIQGSLQVDTAATLTISAGSRVYFHADAPMLVDGSLQVSGTDSTRVLFSGDRLDEPYRNFPGSWPGIYFRGSSANNLLQYATIEDADESVVVTAPPAGTVPKVILRQCIIDNGYDAGIAGIGGSIQAVNCLVSNCGQNVVLGGGGFYQFSQVTAASFSNNLIAHTQPVLAVSDEILNGATLVTGPVQADFVNCIFWGDFGTVADEVVVSQQTNDAWSVGFTNCLWKVMTPPANVTSTAMLVNQDPRFDSVNTFAGYYNFRLKPTSPAIGAGAPDGVTIDLDGKQRPPTGLDLGCYQH